MNILISYNWLKEHLETELSAAEFAAKTTNIGNSVEHMQDLANAFDHICVGVIKSVKPHPNADKLRIVEVDLGDSSVDIVCGGSNLIEEHKVVVALPGAKVKWHGEGDLVEIVETSLRGVKSYGMICGVDEIGFEKLPHAEKEIWDLTEFVDAEAGTPLAVALGLEDTIFDIEVTSNRPDCMSVIGQAREGGAATGDEFRELAEGVNVKTTQKFASAERPTVHVSEKELCPKYTAVRCEGITVGPSPWWLQKKLLLAGHRPINNVVDITNYILHEYGQPLHVFDADTLEGDEINVRKAVAGEKMKALDGKEYALTADMLVIADAKKPVAIAGVMGGEETGSTLTTKNIIIECATFNPVSIRKTARALNLYSDSQLLFEKGLSVEATEPALYRAISLIKELAQPQAISDLETVEATKYVPRVFSFDPEKANALMGLEMKEKDMIATLEQLGFEAKKQKKAFEVTVPYWRDHDVEASVDFVEEIARVYGYEKFPSHLPTGEPPLREADPALLWQSRVKNILKGAGLTETYSYSFVSEKQLEQYGFKASDAIHLKNPLSVDQAFMRPSLAPTMLTTIVENQARFTEADLFEIAPVYLKNGIELPVQPLRAVLATYGKDADALFLRAKGILERLFVETGITGWKLDRTNLDSMRWHAGRSAQILIGDVVVGTIGQVSRTVDFASGLDTTAVLVDLDFEKLLSFFSNKKSFTSLPLYPIVKRDLAFVVSDRTEFESIERAVKAISPLVETLELFDVYRGKGVEEGKKSLAIHLSFRAADRTLATEDADALTQKICLLLEKDFGATMRV